jgi:hypothetical protein
MAVPTVVQCGDSFCNYIFSGYNRIILLYKNNDKYLKLCIFVYALILESWPFPYPLLLLSLLRLMELT